MLGCIFINILYWRMLTVFFCFVCLSGIKKYVVGLIIKTSSDASNVEVSKICL